MRVVRLADSLPTPTLIQDEAPVPQPGRDELLIRVAAAGVILTELSWYPTSHRKTGEARTGAVPSHEFSGTVAAAGADSASFATGDEVYGMNDWFSDGALAEYCVAPSAAVSSKPRRLAHVEAASVPISALTAWQGLFDRARLQAGERVLVHGGAGAVGTYAIQLARLHGAHVITTVSDRNREFVLSLGAEQAIDYRQSRFEESAREMDVVFDTVGGDTLERSWDVLRPSGRMVTVVSTAEQSTDPRVKQAFFIVEPNQKQLAEVGALLDEGKIRPVIDCAIPLSQAPELYAGKFPRQGRGKVVVVVAESGRE